MRNEPSDPLKNEADSASSRVLVTGTSWEANVALNAQRSKVIAWRFATASGAVAAILGVALALLMPLKSVVPMVVMVDKITGESEVVSPARDLVSTSTLTDKHWIQRFVTARERYVYKFIQFDYDTVRLLAGNQTWSKYAPIYDGDSSQDKRLRDEVEIIPIILSITLNGNGMATVRYELRTRDFKNSLPPMVTRRVATLKYEYEAKNLVLEKEAIANPLGFTVTAYQTDPEMGGEAQGAHR